MVIDPRLLAQLMIPLIQKAIAQRNFNGIPTAGLPSYSLQSSIVKDNLDPYLMLNAARENGMRGYEDEFLNLNSTAPSNWMVGVGGGGEIGGILNPQKVISASDDTIQKIYDEAQENYYGNSPATALQSAVSMLRNNPQIGLPNDPAMLPYEDPMTGINDLINKENYTRAPRNSLDNYIDIPLEGEDDNPDDELSKLAKRLVRGY